MKILVIGQAPSRKSDPCKPWSHGASAKRLWKWFGVESRDQLLEVADLFNAVPYWPGSAGAKGDKIPRGEELSMVRDRVIRKIRRGGYKHVIVVGKFVDDLVRDYLRRKNITALTIPHPSGANISANGIDEEMIMKLVKFMMIIGEEK